MPIQVTETGPKVEAIKFHHAELSKSKPGEHLWVVMAMFRVARPTVGGKYFLDTENLLTIEGPGCFHCEQTWTPEIAGQLCPGDPERRKEK